MMDKILSVSNLTKRFIMHLLNEKVIRGCSNISFDLYKGELLGITGPSGAGKSCILKCIYRTYMPTEGKILYNSNSEGMVDLASAPDDMIIELREKEIAHVTQFLHTIPRVTVLNLIAGELINKGVPENEAMLETRSLLAEMRISENLWDAYPSTLSGGEQQRINIAKSFISKPRLLLLDEPTASLDSKSRDIVVKLIKKLKNSGTTIIGVFHDIETMKMVADKVLDVTEKQIREVTKELVV
ncbi:MAG: ATP-binding cassette domain-containing protein [Candidatus Methanoliparum thermophilum]|uniref:ATP-binding cassette domain-containing protein n=2 Tax=Candidatus Methanoliparum TaxID=2545692 RepID=A0A520KS20_METT2|nr:MAG: ATP-binding cassette domain-containing protein [Candidatus Methanoliparum thermophilum]